MKNASQIINIIQDKPQFKKILVHKCIEKLHSALLPQMQKRIKYSYLRNNVLIIVISATLNKYDKDNIINTIKMILNSPLLQESSQFIECNDTHIEEVEVRVDHRPQILYKPFTSDAHKLTYHEQSSGEFQVNIKDERLNNILHDIQKIIKVNHDT